MDHIALARWADLVLVAPATANFMARLTMGLADDLLSALCLATGAPVVIAPAMNHQMWRHQATQDNLAKLQQRGCVCWGPDEGDQACGEHGPGRMLEPDHLLGLIQGFFGSGPLFGVQIVMTSGATREPIDPVRFVGNRSSGKMGFALAKAFRELGAEVTLVSGPTVLSAPTGLKCIWVERAVEMRDAVMDQLMGCDIFVGVAAVADYRPCHVAEEKIKKNKEKVTLELVRNPDILAEVAALEGAPFCVGFAAETEQVEANAALKRQAKGADMIAVNDVSIKEGGFEANENSLVLLWEGGREVLPMMSKAALAEQLAIRIFERYHATIRRQT
jgi:phosphopantothenoylcysteine decarboxylase/phosphopantothenate--cysteine ligase